MIRKLHEDKQQWWKIMLLSGNAERKRASSDKPEWADYLYVWALSQHVVRVGDINMLPVHLGDKLDCSINAEAVRTEQILLSLVFAPGC